MNHDIVEKNIGIMLGLVIAVISLGGLAEIVPLYWQDAVVEPVPGLRPLTALELEGRDIYIREGCVGCHSQMIRPLQAETERYGHYSVAGESVYDHPFLFGSKRTGPDLARVGKRYSDEWHRAHLVNPRDVVPESNMPGFPWLADNTLDGADTAAKMEVLRTLGVPYTDADIAGAQAAVAGKTEMASVIAFLQQLGTHLGKGAR
ncbi:MAG: cytochrome-c oxidase, cbb3-type subunit II [Spirochaetaceae bacterium]|nr:cytochrome-c oxidase, cbb3-type subunit II [Myxococcales bacterium]MCB9722430.1 cytochrome-c oxidase, cbb3-type subunit II [Spirochaetaceae bacterium]HPG28784.1 cytochrome-c oxidase, cbb3-type subunit II [Myxococcota bacterium]